MSCFVPGCKTGYRSQRTKYEKLRMKNPSLFRARTEDVLNDWRNAISRAEKCMTRKDFVCERHFKPDDIEREYTHKMPDGSICRIQKGKPTLKPGAVPLIFPDRMENTCDTFTSKQQSCESGETSNSPKRRKLDVVSTVHCDVDVMDCEMVEKDVPLQPALVIDRLTESESPNDACACAESRTVLHSTECGLEKEVSDVLRDDLVHDNNFEHIPLPSLSWTLSTVNGVDIFSCWAGDLRSVAKRVLVQEDLSLEIFINERPVKVAGMERVESRKDIAHVLTELMKILPCQGANNEQRAKNCSGYIQCKSRHRAGRQTTRCAACRKMRKCLQKKGRKLQPLQKQLEKILRLRSCNKNMKHRNRTLKRQILKLKKKVETMRVQCSKAKTHAIEEAILHLPDNQKLAVKACLAASQVKNSKGMRYTNERVFECLLLLIKSRKTYEHLRVHQILRMPCIDTLNEYIKAMKGALLLDEINLLKSLYFDRKNLRFQDFTNLGEYTPGHQKSKKGDQGGKWVQSLACFLSKGCASRVTLHKILMECIVLTEQCGLYVDVILSDRATWNRSMWEQFGVTEEKVHVEHIFDPTRLWFVSDFPHLIKNTRNFLTKYRKHDGIWTPDGIVRIKHSDALLKIENSKSFNLKANFKLTHDHVRPQYFQKMNVAMAFQFFGVAHAMEIFENDHEDLKDSKGMQTFCRRMKKLITAMNSRTPIDAMKPGNKAWTDVTEFVEYIGAWEKEAIERGYDFLSHSTCYGTKVALQAALEICTYLVEDCGFAYVMMARLNQDNLERFFGMMRNSCGSDEHPDSTLFVQMYRLVSTYSLVKPLKGSNISGADTINVLLSIKNLNDANERRDQWDTQIDTILDRGTNMDVLYDAASLLKEHDYFKCNTSGYVLAYVAGYVTRKGTRFAVFDEEGDRSVCQDCLQSLELPASDAIPENHKLIDIKSRGNLKHPSRKLEELLSILERATVETLSSEELNENTLFSVTKAVDELPPITLVGCDKHKRLLTDSVMRFYLLTRIYFITKQDSNNNNIERKQTRKRRQAFKLTYSKDEPKKCNITAKEKTLPVKAAKVWEENVSVSASTKACLKRKRLCPKRKPLNDAKSRMNVQSM